MKFNTITLGCKVNSYETDYIKEQFKKDGFKEVSLKENPDVIIINTCSVTNQSDAKSRHFIRLARRICPLSVIVVCGCSAQNHQDKLAELDIDILIGNKEKSKILSLVKDYLKTHQKQEKFYDVSNIEFEDMMLKSEEDHTRAFVKIQDGCNNFCSYCIIPYLRGNIRSKNINTAYEEVKSLVETGHHEIVLTGIHTGSYGTGTPYDLVDLIRKISTIEKLDRIRISSIEITELSDKFLDELKNNPKICNHLHIPLQSGSDIVLKYMNRKYDLKYYEEKIDKIRSIRPNISITTDLIVGFPHETDEEFENTLKFLETIKFTKVHTFPFSLRNGTKAEEMSQFFVNENIKKERVHRVIELSNKFEHDYYQKFISSTMEVIIETSDSTGSRGHTSNYILVHTLETLEEGKSYPIKLTSLDGNTVNGILEKVE